MKFSLFLYVNANTRYIKRAPRNVNTTLGRGPVHATEKGDASAASTHAFTLCLFCIETKASAACQRVHASKPTRIGNKAQFSIRICIDQYRSDISSSPSYDRSYLRTRAHS